MEPLLKLFKKCPITSLEGRLFNSNETHTVGANCSFLIFKCLYLRLTHIQLLLLVFQLAYIEHFFNTQVNLKLRPDGIVSSIFSFWMSRVMGGTLSRYPLPHQKRNTRTKVTVYATERNTKTKLLQNLVQPYLLAFKQALPSFARVPTKEDPFNPSYYANKIIESNCYPESCDVINNVK